MAYIQNMWQLASQGSLQGIYFWIAVYLLGACAYSLVGQLRTRTWPSTAAVLVDAGVDSFGSTTPQLASQQYVAKALYRYDVGGLSYQGSRISPWVIVTSHNARLLLQKQLSGITRYPDGRVKVFYNPAKPAKSYLVVAGIRGIMVTLLIGVTPVMAYIYHYHW